jgi:hypothetical protein
MGVKLWITLVAVAACAVLAAPAGARSVPRGFYGAVYDGAVAQAPFDVQNAQFARMARSGVESVRVVFSWSDAQPTAGGPIDFSHIDPLVAGAVAHRISLLPVVIYAPPWAREDQSLFNSPPARVADYTAFLQALVGRYGPHGTFWAEHPELPRRALRTWQIWNEPQLRYQWNAPGFAKDYGELLRASYQTLKQADRGSTVVLAGATNLSWKAIAQLYSAGGIHGYFDVAAVHPYTATPAHVLRIVRLVRGVLRRHHDARVPIWVTELGFPASKGRVHSDNSLQTTPRKAARRLTGAYARLARHRRGRRPAAARVFWYTWASPYSGTDIFNFSGLWRFDGVDGFKAQPQLAAYVHSARRHEGCRKAASGKCA